MFYSEYALLWQLKKEGNGNSLAVQWLGFGALPAEGPGSIPGLVGELRSRKPRGMAKKKGKKVSKGRNWKEKLRKLPAL